MSSRQLGSMVSVSIDGGSERRTVDASLFGVLSFQPSALEFTRESTMLVDVVGTDSVRSMTSTVLHSRDSGECSTIGLRERVSFERLVAGGVGKGPTGVVTEHGRPSATAHFYYLLIPSYDIDTELSNFLTHLQETHNDFRIDTAPLSGLAGYSVFGFGDAQ